MQGRENEMKMLILMAVVIWAFVGMLNAIDLEELGSTEADRIARIDAIR